jgi:hypothetical protein
MDATASRAKIIDGVWTRRVPWGQKGEWRTDIFKSVLSDARLKECHFILKDGPTVLIPAGELRRILKNGRELTAVASGVLST